MMLVRVIVPTAGERQQFWERCPAVRKQRVNRLGSCQESISECVPEVYWPFLPPDLDNQIYALIAKVMPPLVTRS